MPERCPACHSRVVQQGAYHVCSGGLICPAQQMGGIEHFASRGAMEIEHLGEKTVRQLVEQRIVADVADLYRIGREDLSGLEGFADKSIDNLLLAVQGSKQRPLDRFLYALGIPNVGQHVARVLAQHFGSLDAVMQAGEVELTEVHEIGPEVARSVSSFFRNEDNVRVIQRLRKAGVEPVWEHKDKPTSFGGMKIVFTGALQHLERGEAKRLVEERGGRVTSSVSKNTSLVVVGENPGSKLEQAREHGVKVIGEKDFLELLE